MASELKGLNELQKNIKTLGSTSFANRLAKSVLAAGGTVAVKEIKKAAPHGTTGQEEKSIGKRTEKNTKGGIITEKVGIGVGKPRSGYQPHVHLVALGTKPRFRRSIGGRFSYIKNPTTRQLSTGTMPANPFVREAFNRSRSAAIAAMNKRFEKKLAEEVAKLGR